MRLLALKAQPSVAESSWNVMAHGDARDGKWRGNWRMEWVASTLHTTSEYGVSSITTADAYTSATSSRRPRQFKWNRPFRRKTKSGFCACAITFQTLSNNVRCVYRDNGHGLRCLWGANWIIFNERLHMSKRHFLSCKFTFFAYKHRYNSCNPAISTSITE
jgi:hypothetical protein